MRILLYPSTAIPVLQAQDLPEAAQSVPEFQAKISSSSPMYTRKKLLSR